MPTHVICTSPLVNSFTFVISLYHSLFCSHLCSLFCVFFFLFSLALFSMFINHNLLVQNAYRRIFNFDWYWPKCSKQNPKWTQPKPSQPKSDPNKTQLWTSLCWTIRKPRLSDWVSWYHVLTPSCWRSKEAHSIDVNRFLRERAKEWGERERKKKKKKKKKK